MIFSFCKSAGDYADIAWWSDHEFVKVRGAKRRDHARKGRKLPGSVMGFGEVHLRQPFHSVFPQQAKVDGCSQGAEPALVGANVGGGLLVSANAYGNRPPRQIQVGLKYVF